jgi:hypothetical protein
VSVMFGYYKDYLLNSMYDWGSWLIFPLLLAPAVYLAFFCLDLGAAKVGSMVENRSVRRRLVGIGALLFYAAIGLRSVMGSGFGARGDFLAPISLVFACGTLFLVSLQALLEKPVHLVSMVIPWVKRGWWARLIGRFFYPGWHSGTFFSGALLLMGVGASMIGLLQAQSRFSFDIFNNLRSEEWAILVVGFGAVAGMLVAPVVLYQVFLRKRLVWHFGTWLLGVVLLGVLHLLVVAVAAGLEDENLLKWGAPLPTMGISLVDKSVDGYRHFRSRSVHGEELLDLEYLDIIPVSGIVLIAWWALAVLVALRAFRETRALEQEAIASLKQIPSG